MIGDADLWCSVNCSLLSFQASLPWPQFLRHRHKGRDETCKKGNSISEVYESISRSICHPNKQLRPDWSRSEYTSCMQIYIQQLWQVIQLKHRNKTAALIYRRVCFSLYKNKADLAIWNISLQFILTPSYIVPA